MERCRQKVAAACPDVYTMSVVPQWFDVLPKGVSKLTGTIMGLFSIYFYLQGSMSLLICIMMLISAFMIYESLDGVGSFSFTS